MAFDAREAVKGLSTDPFPFVGMDGETYELPNINTLTGAQAKRLQAGDDEVFAEISSEETYDAILALPAGVGEELAKAWAAHGGKSGKAASASSRPTPRKKRSR